jgi:hypothetical protein
MSFRGRKQVYNPSISNLLVRGLVFSDSNTIPIATNPSVVWISNGWVQSNDYCIYVDFSLGDSPLLPDKTTVPKAKPSRQPKDFHYITKYISSVLSRRNNETSEKGGVDEYINTRFRFYHYHDLKCRQQEFIQNRDIFENTDVISIWFDRTKPDSLHNAIYKVRMDLQRGTFSRGIYHSHLFFSFCPFSGIQLCWALRLELPFAWSDTYLMPTLP